jgi:L-lactate dehydrogenase complex protein LldE
MKTKVQLLITCIIDSLYPQIGEAVVRVLNKAGVEVEFPQNQTCCGQPAFNAGMRSQARLMAKHTIEVFEATSGLIIIPSGSCAAMLRHGYLELFVDDPAWLSRAKSLAERVYEFSEFLVDIMDLDDLEVSYPGRIAYHASCHLLRELNVNDQPRRLLSKVRDCELVELPYAEDCCGFGGLFSIEHPEISSAMLARKIENIESSGADFVVSCDASCIANMNGGLNRLGKRQRALHLAQILEKYE